MTDELRRGPVVDSQAESTPEEEAALLEQSQNAVHSAPPAPFKAIQLLYEAACQDTVGGQAARNFLFWLNGMPDPTGFPGDGGLELRRLDGMHRKAAIEVLAWWAGPAQSDDPLCHVLAKLLSQFAGNKKLEPWEV